MGGQCMAAATSCCQDKPSCQPDWAPCAQCAPRVIGRCCLAALQIRQTSHIRLSGTSLHVLNRPLVPPIAAPVQGELLEAVPGCTNQTVSNHIGYFGPSPHGHHTACALLASQLAWTLTTKPVADRLPMPDEPLRPGVLEVHCSCSSDCTCPLEQCTANKACSRHWQLLPARQATHVGLRGTPLQVLDRLRVPLVGRADLPAASRHGTPHVQVPLAVAGGQLPCCLRGPVNGIPLCGVPVGLQGCQLQCLVLAGLAASVPKFLCSRGEVKHLHVAAGQGLTRKRTVPAGLGSAPDLCMLLCSRCQCKTFGQVQRAQDK